MNLKTTHNLIDISIIVPVYNVEKHIKTCLDSIYNQKFSGSIEVIAVDDCSSDNSLKILSDYKLKNHNLIIVNHKTNQRLASARSSGMKIAKGEYILHVDSDDKLIPNSLEILFDKCKESKADVIAFNYVIEDEFGKQTFINKIKQDIITDDKIKIQDYFFGGCWNKIVKKSLTQKMIYSSSEAPKSTEDLIYCSEILLRANSICLFTKNLYCYSYNSNSITNITKPIGYLQNQLIIINNLKKLFIKYKPTLEFKNKLLSYFEKWIYLAICKIHFWSRKDLKLTQELINSLFLVGILDSIRINKLIKSLNNKFFCLWYVTKYFGLRYSLGIVYRTFKK
jgi:glycosyltransferase involved in cell wall biosynthesis